MQYRVYIRLQTEPQTVQSRTFEGTDENGRNAQEQAHHWVNEHDPRSTNASLYNRHTDADTWNYTSSYMGWSS